MRPIDADRLAKAVKEMIGLETGIGREINDGMIAAYAMIAMAPTLTLDGLRPEGRWINWGKSGTPTYENYGTCSVCHEDAEIHTEHRNYCPNCGANMRGGDSDEFD